MDKSDPWRSRSLYSCLEELRTRVEELEKKDSPTTWPGAATSMAFYLIMAYLVIMCCAGGFS